jgi:hypothetical protein
LCPHLRIYPITKLVNPLGTNPIFFVSFCVFLWPFSLVSFFLLSYQSLSLQDILIDLLGPEAFVIFSSILQIFDYVQEFSHCTSLQPARIGRVHTLTLGFSASFSHPDNGLPARISDSHIVLYNLPANIIFQNLDLSFGFSNCPEQFDYLL